MLYWVLAVSLSDVWLALALPVAPSWEASEKPQPKLQRVAMQIYNASMEGPVVAVGNQAVAGAQLPEDVRAESL